jgi:broad-specificity NMP kinase
MFNICQQCGLWSDEQMVDPDGPYALCPHCGYQHWFRRLPLFVVTGPSGVGKSTLCIELAPNLPGYVCLESDILWGNVPATAEDNYRGYWNIWLNMITAIHQSSRSVVLFGTTLPDKLEACPVRRYLSIIHYLTIVCADEELTRRLQGRPAWRRCDEAFIANMVTFNSWLKAHANTTVPPMTLLDDTDLSIAQTASAIAQWIRDKSGNYTN